MAPRTLKSTSKPASNSNQPEMGEKDRIASLVHEKSILRIINAFALDLIGISTEHDLAWYVAREVVGKLGFNDCVIYSIDTEHAVLRQRAAIGQEKNPTHDVIANPLVIPVGQGITGHVARTGQPEIIDDAATDARYIPDVQLARSEICIPVLIDDNVVALIDCEDPHVAHFNQSDLEILNTVAALMAAKLKFIQSDKTESINRTLSKEIEERRAVEERLRESEMWLRSIIDNLPLALTIKNTQGEFTVVNPVAEKLFNGIKSGMTIGDSFPKKIAEEFTAQDAAVFAAAHVMTFEDNLSTVDGDYTIMTTKFPMVGQHGDISAIGAISLDATREREARTKLRESEERFRQIANISSDWVWEMDADLRFSYVSEGFERMTGIPPDHILGQTRQEIHTPDTLKQPNWKNHLEHLAQRRRFRGFEAELYGPDGKKLFFRLNGSPAFNQMGEFKGYRGTGTDITERIKAEASLREQEARLRHAAALTKVGHFVWDGINKRTLSCTDELAQIHGVSANEYISFTNSMENLQSWIHPDDLEHYITVVKQENWGRYLPTAELKTPTYDVEFRIVTRDGQIRHVREIGEPTFDKHGQLIQTSGAIQDITERVKAERELLRTQRTMERLLDTTQQGYWYIDTEARTIDVNPAMCEILGYSREDIIGRHIYDFADEENTNIFHEQVEKRKHGEAAGYEVELLHADGTSISCFNNANPAYDADGNLIGAFGLFTNISEIKYNQRLLEASVSDLKDAQSQNLKAKEAAEAADRAKSEFLATVSHEIRTPMTGVIGVADLLSHTAMSSDQLRMVNTVRQSGAALMRIIDDILDFSKIEAHRLELEALPMSIRDVVEDVVTTLGPNAEDNGVALFMYVDPNIPDWILGDPVRIRQILFNLTGNAIKFTDGDKNKRGRVMVRATLISARRGDVIRVGFRIEDNGIGISVEGQKKLFQAFSQAEGSTTRRFGGTGLGLAICKRLVDMMDGDIGAESQLGTGSTFVVDIPFGTASAHGLTLNEEREFGGLRIMIACNDMERSTLLGRYLSHWGADVQVEQTLLSGISQSLNNAAKSMPFDVVVLDDDWKLEEARQACEQAISDPSQSETRYLIVTRTQKFITFEPDPTRAVCVKTSPLTRSAFLKAVSVAAGRSSPNIELDERRMVIDLGTNAPSVYEAERNGQLVLLAEDNKVNQDVISHQLDTLGYAVDIANNGKEALHKYRHRQYGLVLADLHMPEIDGYELARQIRRHEAATATRIPILAVTAAALQPELDRTFDAGMDGYVIKPVELLRLKDVLDQWLPIADTQASPCAAVEYESSALIDFDMLRSIVGDKPELHEKFFRRFLDTLDTMRHDLETAYKANDLQRYSDLAHQLKSSARSIGAVPLSEMCQALEQICDDADMDTLSTQHTKFMVDINDVKLHLETHIG